MEKTTYVSPEEMAIGYKWMQTFDETSGNIIRKYKQNTFQFIRPSSTIRALFTDQNFLKMYLDSINHEQHKCEDGVYKDYCCSSNFRRSEFFCENPNALKLMLYTDDFEPGEALKSKAGKHKICAFYMIIRNMPKKMQSKLSNIFLVAVASSEDLKNDSSIASIFDVIIEDLKFLETSGIQIANGSTVKACLIAMSFDNLGANCSYGFVQGFQANFYCRFCEVHKNECKKLTKENSDKLRNIQSYDQICARILSEDNLDATETKGIRYYCKLNDLSNFHILQNYSVDIMHDILEGAVPFTLHAIFEYAFNKKIFNLSHLQNMVQFFNYGFLKKRNIPSKLKIEPKNLGQNATQLYCLATNIAFILYPFKNELHEIWPIIQSLLVIIEIVFSEEIHDSDLNRLKSTPKRKGFNSKTSSQTLCDSN